MTEQPEPGYDADESASHSETGAHYLAEGFPAVQAVLADMADLDDVPLGEQVAVFERAHDQLRRALDSTPGDGALSDGG